MKLFTAFGALSFSLAVLGVAQAATTQPDGARPRNKYQLAMTRDAHFSPLGQKVNAEYDEIIHLMLDRPTLVDPAKRQVLLEKVKPLLLQLRADAAALAVQDGNSAVMVNLSKSVDAQTTERLAMLGDPETTAQLAADVAGPDVAKAMKANAVLLKCRWKLSDDAASGVAVVDELERLGRAHPDNADLATLTFELSVETGDPALRERLLVLGTEVMKGAAVDRFEPMRKIRAAAAETTKSLGQPFALTGTTVDGKPFTTADWKGKVVLVDFWATWCGPCKAALPEIRKLYAESHDKGFEIVGVSNDFSVPALQKYVAENAMPWPQLVDPDAAAKQAWNPITLNVGVDSIPRLFVINKRGELVDIDATHTFQDVVAKALAE